MARVVASRAFDIFNPQFSAGVPTYASSSSISVAYGNNTLVFEGYGFTYDFYGRISGGTMTSITQFTNGQTIGKFDQFAVSASAAGGYIADNNIKGLYAYVQNGNDSIFGSAGNDRLVGHNGDDYINGGGGNDYIDGGAGNDVITVGRGSSFVTGGQGFDIVNLPGRAGTYTQSTNPDGRQFYSGVEQVNVNIAETERVHFSDGVLGFDLMGNAGQAYRLYQAAFDRAPDAVGLGYWIRELDAEKGGLAWMAYNFIISNEFRSKYGTPESVSNETFLTLIYNNVLDRNPDRQGFEYWMDELDRGFSRERVLASFSESNENIANVAEAIENGIWFV